MKRLTVVRNTLTTVLLLAANLTGCAYAQRIPVTPGLTELPGPSNAYALDAFPATWPNTDSVFVVLTFSGGGTRAAALAYGVLRELQATQIDSGTKSRTLLDEVDLISSVSGGSFTAATFALFGARGLDGFENGFLKWNAERALAERGARSAYKWLGHGPYGRSDIATEVWDERLFHGATFADLVRRHARPFLFINAEDMAAGVPFTFTQEWFSPMCGDLNRTQIARAVAASSAFPGLLDPLTLQNHAGQCNFSPPGWVRSGLLDASSNPEAYRQSTLLMSYTDRNRRPFVHLFDGGPADNLGVRPSFVLFLPQAEMQVFSGASRTILSTTCSSLSSTRERQKVPGLIAVLIFRT